MTTGAAAEVVEQSGGVGAPEGSPPAVAPPPSAPTEGGQPAPGAQPPADGGGAAGAAPAATPASPKQITPPQFPWSEYRKQETQLQRERADRQRLEQQLQQVQQQAGQWETERASLRERAESYDKLAALVERDPQFATELEARLRGAPSTARGAAAAAALPKEFLDEWRQERDQVKQLFDAFQQERMGREQMQEQARLQTLDTQLNGSLTGLLKQHEYPEAMLPQAKAYVLQRVREIGDAKIEEVPYLFAEWFNAQEQAFHDRMARFTKGAQAQQSLPVSPGTGAQAPIQAAPDLSDPSKAGKVLEERLRALGWQG